MSSAPFGQQQISPIPDGGLGDFGKSLQQPGQRDFHPDMIIRHIEMARCCLPERADAKDHAILLPSLFIHFQHRNAGGGARQSRLEAARGLVAAMTRTVERFDSDPSSLLYGDRRQGYRPQ